MSLINDSMFFLMPGASLIAVGSEAAYPTIKYPNSPTDAKEKGQIGKHETPTILAWKNMF